MEDNELCIFGTVKTPDDTHGTAAVRDAICGLPGEKKVLHTRLPWSRKRISDGPVLPKRTAFETAGDQERGHFATIDMLDWNCNPLRCKQRADSRLSNYSHSPMRNGICKCLRSKSPRASGSQGRREVNLDVRSLTHAADSPIHAQYRHILDVGLEANA